MVSKRMGASVALWGAVLLVALTAALLSGCSPKPVPGTPEMPLQLREKIIAKDSKLSRHLRVVHHKAERTNGGLLQVKLGLDNADDDQLWCDIQVVFRDSDGFEIESTNWQPLLLTADQVTYYETKSLSPKAADYTVFLKNARESVAH
ncbi:MAG: hypothetical protein HQ546_04970 [Planctomycetes bacterium]|nr:hypothetical protein [Planctomycetota bacterium]